MEANTFFISNFNRAKPPHWVEQGASLAWLAEAHARKSQDLSRETLFKLFNRFGCGPDRIERRGTFLKDFAHSNWDEMQIFGRDASIDDRQAFFKEAVLGSVSKLYPERKPEFKNWIHVTCTGYASPSVIQMLASGREWGGEVECLHAYHMGCYAAIPALRMARGNLDADILHTELCTLHLDPSRHEPEQLVIQSLFADGIIRYRASASRPEHGYQIEELKEVIAPGSIQQMTWDVSARGFRMTLDRDVPKHVEAAVKGAVSAWQTPNTVYAIHPGGPRIIDAVKEALSLSEEQVYFSREVLRDFGNMSSATLPHVWQRMGEHLQPGTPVISLAFGPGLTIAASHMRSV